MPPLPYISMIKDLLSPAPGQSEQLPVAAALNRVLASSHFALFSQPPYDQSLRDGYALADHGPVQTYTLIDGEAFAGNSERYQLASGEACVVMTGGLLPAGTVGVAAQEDCRVDAGLLTVNYSSKRYLHRAGDIVALGEELAAQGTVLSPEYLAKLAAAGHEMLEVYKKPRLALLATGSELRPLGQKLQQGEKVASNSYLLAALAQKYGAEVSDHGSCRDDEPTLLQAFARLAAEDTDIIVSTGGMGPGRYDLVLSCFRQLGGEVICEKLPLSPGKSMLLGRVAGKIFVGLPGTPGAIRPLFTELIVRAILSLQGLDYECCLQRQLPLAEDLRLRPGMQTILYSGVIVWSDAVVAVRPDRRVTSPDCYIVVPPGSEYLKAGTTVTVHLTDSPLT